MRSIVSIEKNIGYSWPLILIFIWQIYNKKEKEAEAPLTQSNEYKNKYY